MIHWGPFDFVDCRVQIRSPSVEFFEIWFVQPECKRIAFDHIILEALQIKFVVQDYFC